MISATEARKITEESRSKLQITINEIIYYIDDAIHDGKCTVVINGFISDKTVEILKEYGYTIMEFDTHFQIVW